MNHIISKNNLILATIISVYLIVSFIYINFPGYYYDEVLYSPSMFVPCTENPFNYFVIKILGFCFPVLSMGYIGSLKTYLLFPFTLISVSKTFFVYRGISILFGALSLFFVYKINKLLKLKNIINYLTLILISFNLSFVFGIKYDWGPVAISIFLKTLFIYFSLRLVSKLNNKINTKEFLILTALLVAISIVGVFNKLDFIFFLVPFCLCLFVVKSFRTKIFALISQYRKAILPQALILVSFCFTLFYLLQDKISLFLKSESISAIGTSQKLNNLGDVLYGNSVTKVISNVKLYSGLEELLFILFAGIIGLIIAGLYRSNFRLKKKETYVIVSSILYFLFILFFGKSGGPHHFIATFPIPFVVFGILLNKIVLKSYSKFLLTIFVVCYITHTAIIYKYSINLFINDKVRPSWSKTLQEVTNYIQSEHSKKVIYTTDWGISNQIIIYSKGNLSIQEPFRPISQIQSQDVQNKITNVKTENSVAIKFFKNDVFKDATKNFPYSKYQNQKIFYDNNSPVFIIFY